MLDAKGDPKYKKRKGYLLPVYGLPHGIITIDKRRGQDVWDMALFAEHSLARDWIALSALRPLYLSVHEIKVPRQRWVRSMALQTTNPMFE